LISADRAQRLAAHAALTNWAAKEHDAAKALFLDLMRTSQEPEIRERCLQLLRPIAAREYGNFGDGYMGISMGEEVPVPLPGQDKPCFGLMITAVTGDSPAAKAELKEGDVIVSINNHRWQQPQAVIDLDHGLSAKIRAAGAGSKPRFGIWRKKELIEVEVHLSRRPSNLEQLPMQILPNGGIRMDEKELKQLVEDEKNSNAFFTEWLDRQLAAKPGK